ncbi:MAG: HAD hydrolase family protein [Chloroflexota bacterium]|nr:HAD hydrolase family protein [Chloroflexota bacterium]
MRYLALACDYDGTLAHDGLVPDDTVAALERVVATGRRLILVSGRELEDLLSVFPRTDLFERVVVENGALLYRPATREEKVLGEPPPAQFVQLLRDRRVSPLSVGRVIVATWEPNETVVLQAIRDLGLEHQVIFNKGAVMVLPPGVNKASGLQAALLELSLSGHNTVGIGDAENDHAFLSLCEVSVAVSNALPALKERADLVTRADHGQGVEELIAELVSTDLAGLEGQLTRHHVTLGSSDGRDVRIPPHGRTVLVAGPSGSGKSTLTTGFLERLAQRAYQFCLVDPEGDYESFDPAVVVLGDSARAPTTDEVLALLEKPDQSSIVNLLAIPLGDRPRFFQELLVRVQELRARTGRPHWIVVDEAHHMLPSDWHPVGTTVPQELDGLFLITVHPDLLAPLVLSTVELLIAVGASPAETLERFARVIEEPAPEVRFRLEPGEALLWARGEATEPVRFLVTPPSSEQRRHQRKYARGELGPDKSFYFRGQDGKLNLRAQNLVLFLQLAEGVDDETWLHHLRTGEYSAWLRDAIKDAELAAEVAQVELEDALSAQESRTRIRAAIEKRYTAPV